MYKNHNPRNTIHIQPVCQKENVNAKWLGQVISNLVTALPMQFKVLAHCNHTVHKNNNSTRHIHYICEFLSYRALVGFK